MTNTTLRTDVSVALGGVVVLLVGIPVVLGLITEGCGPPS
jgi:hypothetical protein